MKTRDFQWKNRLFSKLSFITWFGSQDFFFPARSTVINEPGFNIIQLKSRWTTVSIITLIPVCRKKDNTGLPASRLYTCSVLLRLPWTLLFTSSHPCHAMHPACSRTAGCGQGGRWPLAQPSWRKTQREREWRWVTNFKHCTASLWEGAFLFWCGCKRD